MGSVFSCVLPMSSNFGIVDLNPSPCTARCNGGLFNTKTRAHIDLFLFTRFVSPRIGSLSDKYGRKKILLFTMIGNLLSALV